MTVVAWQRFRAWWNGTKPTDVLGLVFTLASVAFAGWALYKSNETAKAQRAASDDQADFQRRAEEEQSAPLLAPETPPGVRGKKIRVTTQYATVHKRADRLFLDRKGPRFVIPVRNGGAGIALTVGLPVLVEDCDQEPRTLPAPTVGLLGTYVIPTGESDQLAYLQPKRTATGFEPGRVRVAGRSRWYGWDYKHFGTKPTPATRKVLLWYTDGAQHELRWTCTSYIPAKGSAGGSQYAVESQIYGHRPWLVRPGAGAR
jgi:hypothetical protein